MESRGVSYQIPVSFHDNSYEVGDRQFFGPDLIKESERKVKLIPDRVKAAQSRQKSYADSKRKEIVYEVGDRVYLCVPPF